ncbi:hypothetical protein [Nocardia farcinica]
MTSFQARLPASQIDDTYPCSSPDLIAAWRPAQEAETNLTDDLEEHAAE